MISEKDLIIPSLVIINNESEKGITTSDLLNNLRKILDPKGDDLIILENRADDKFSQKVRNLKSHKTLEKLDYVEFTNNKFFIKEKGTKELESYFQKNTDSRFIKYLNNVKFISPEIDYKNELILFCELSNFYFSKRLTNIFINNNFIYPIDLLKYGVNNLIKLPNSGVKTVNEFINFLSEYNISLDNLSFDYKSVNTNNYINVNKNQIKLFIANFHKNHHNAEFLDQFIINYINDKNLHKGNIVRLNYLIENRLGLFGKKSLTLEQCSKYFSLTRERVRQIIDNVLKVISKNKYFLEQFNLIAKLFDNNKIIEKNLLIKNIKNLKVFSDDVDLSGIQILLNQFLKFNIYKETIKISNSSVNFDIYTPNKKHISRFREFMKFIKTKSKKRPLDYRDVLRNFNDLFDIEDRSIFSFLRNIEIIDFIDNHKFVYFKTDSHINNKIGKIFSLPGVNKISIDELFILINQDYRYKVSTKDLLISHIIKSGMNIVDGYLVKNDNIKLFPLSVKEKNLVNLFNENGNPLILEKIEEIRDKYNLETSTLYVYLSYRSITREVTPGVYSLAGSEVSKSEINNLAIERNNLIKEIKTDLTTRWLEDGNLSISLKVTHYLSRFQTIILPTNVMKLLIGKFTCDNYDIEIKFGNNSFWTLPRLIDTLRKKPGDSLLIIINFADKKFYIE